MRVSTDGVAIPELIETIKQAIKEANVSNADPDRDLRVGSVHLTLNAVATRSFGGGLDFRVPFIGMQVKVGKKLTRQDTHTIEIALCLPISGIGRRYAAAASAQSSSRPSTQSAPR